MKFYVDELPEHYWECPWAKARQDRGGIICCSAMPNDAPCSRFNSWRTPEAKEDADPKECLCLKVFPQGGTISGLEEGIWP